MSGVDQEEGTFSGGADHIKSPSSTAGPLSFFSFTSFLSPTRLKL
jgi:hypothetical protein